MLLVEYHTIQVYIRRKRDKSDESEILDTIFVKPVGSLSPTNTVRYWQFLREENTERHLLGYNYTFLNTTVTKIF